MLPFLKLKKEVGATGPVESITRESDDGEDYDMLESAAEDLISAVHSKNVKAVASALKAAFEMMESEPHEEGEHV